MIKLIKPLAITLFALFVLAVFAGVMYYSFHALMLIFPGDLAGQLFGMALFDLAALAWFLVFVAACASTMQYVFSVIGFLLGIAGTLGLVGIEVGISSGMLDAAQMAKPLSYIFIVAMIGHLLLIYARHASAPEIAADISLGIERARITDNAQRQAERMLTDNQQALAFPIAQEHVRRVVHDLNLRPREGDVLDLNAMDVVPAEAETEPKTGKGKSWDFLSRILPGWGNDAKGYGFTVPSVTTSSQPQTPKTPSPVPADAGPAGGGESGLKA